MLIHLNMWKIFIAVVFFLTHEVKGQLVTFDFVGLVGNEITVASNSNSAGVQPSAISRGPGVSATANADRFNSTGWTINSTLDPTDYLEIVLKPVTGYVLNVSSITIQHQRSGTGPVSFVLRTSLDAYSNDATNVIVLGSDPTTTQTSVFNFLNSLQLISETRIRLYAYSAESGIGTWGPGDGTGNDIIVTGSVATGPLATKFSNLTAHYLNQRIHIQWANLTEKEVVHYSIERSGSGRDFVSIGTESPTRNDGGEAIYEWLDPSPLPGVNYYRIQSLELDGKMCTSVIVRVDRPGGALSIYPNPLTGSTLTLQADMPRGNYPLRILNVQGQEVYRGELQHIGGVGTRTIELPGLKSGTYYLVVGEKVLPFLKY